MKSVDNKLDFTGDIIVGLNPIVVLANTTAVNGALYNASATATFTDPTGVEGLGYEVKVLAGSATIGGVAYAIAGSVINRVFQGGVWASYLIGSGVGSAGLTSFNGRTAAAAVFLIGDIPSVAAPAINSTPVVATDGYQTVVNKLQSQVSTALANAGNPLQAETILYVNKVRAKANTYLDSVTIQGIDRFFTTGKADGWLPLMKWAWCPMGSSFAGSLVNLFTVAGVPDELINTNFVAADYSPQYGFGTGEATNSNKNLNLGFIPSSVGLTNTNIALGEFIPDISAGAPPAFTFCINTTSGGGFPPAFSFRSDGNVLSRAGGSGGNSFIATKAPATLIGSFGAGSKFIGYTNGCRAIDSNATIQSAIALDVAPTLFHTAGYGSNAKGRIGFAFISSFLTAEQSKSISDAIRLLMIQINRINNQGGIGLFFGDSITNAAFPGQWTSIVCSGLSLVELNFGVGSSRLSTNVVGGGDDGVVAAINRYKDTDNTNSNTVFIMLGTNDVGADGTANGDPAKIAQFSTNYTTLLNHFIGKRYNVIAVGLTWNAPFSVTLRNAYQNATFNAAKALNVKYVDCETLFSDKPSPGSFFYDGVHPGENGHRLISQAVLGVMNGRLNRNPLVTFPSIPGITQADLSFTVLGATVNNTVSIGLTTLTTGLLYQAFVSAVDTVTIRCINNTAVAVIPPSQYININVLY